MNVVIPDRLVDQLKDAVSASRPNTAKVRSLVAEIVAYREHGSTAGEPWAILVGGVVQDASGDLLHTDLDWMTDPPVDGADRTEAEGSWLALTAAVAAGSVAWGDDLHEVEEWLTSIYKNEDTPDDQKIWNRKGA